MRGGGRVIEPGRPPRGVPRRRSGRRPEILVRRAAHSPRSRRSNRYSISHSRNASRAAYSKRAWALATGTGSPRLRSCSYTAKPSCLRFSLFLLAGGSQFHAAHLVVACIEVSLGVVLSRPRSTKPGGFGLSGLRGEFLAAMRGLFRRRPGERPNLVGESHDALRNAGRPRALAQGRSVVEGGLHALGTTPNITDGRMLPCSIRRVKGFAAIIRGEKRRGRA